MIASSGQDLRFALRQLRKSPGFTAVALITLALGIGANTAIFTVLQGVVLAALPYFQPDRLVIIWENNPRFPRVWNSYPNFLDWQRSVHSFQQMAAFREQGMDLTFPGSASHLKANQISAGFFSTLGTGLALGREFTPQENEPGGTPAVVLSDHLWRERFGGSPEALGKGVTLDGVNYSIVGVAPRGFRLLEGADVYTPLGQLGPLILNDRAGHDGTFTVARLESGISISQSQSEMNTIQSRLDREYPNDNRDLGIYVEPLKQVVIGDAGQTLTLLLAAVGLVLLITCANIANLLLARSASRTREFAIRSAIGANRIRLARQLLTESVILSLAGAGLGILIALYGTKSVLAAMPGVLPRTENVAVNASVLIYTLILSVLVGILFGLAPVLKSWSTDLQVALKEGGPGLTGSHRRTQSTFVVVQMASTLVLLVFAGLLLRTILHLRNVRPGFDTSNVIAFKVGVSRTLTKTPAGTRIAYQELIERIRRIPGVEAADLTTALPLTGEGGYLPFWLDSRKPESLQAAPRTGWFLTGPDYLRTVGMQLLEGRFFTEQDNTKSPCVAVIDSNFARSFFTDGKPIGHTITAGFASFGPCAIIGVVNHIKYAGLQDNGPANQYQAYYSLYQDPDEWVPLNFADVRVMVRTPLEAAALIPAVKPAVYQSDTEQPIYEVQTMQQIVSDSMSAERFPMVLLAAFGGLALLLASVGIYGTISYSVAQRVREVGIRMALGADKGNVLLMFVGQELRLALTGIVVGIVAALSLTRTLSSFSHLLYQVGTADSLTFSSVSFGLTILAALAGYVPSRRAAKVDPVVALRCE
jgi:predicted permease